jgi:nucleoid-associated protein
MSFELTHAVIHGFTKEANTSVVTSVVEKEVLLDSGLPAVISLVSQVSRLLGQPGNAVTYGQFADDLRQGRFPPKFREHAGALFDPASFLTLSHIAVAELAAQAEEEPLSTGGHILVAQYLTDGAAFILVAMIKQKGGLILDENYVPKEIIEVDLAKVHQAARINVARYKLVETQDIESDEEEPDRTYLCFLGQRRDNLAAGYFIKALGCSPGIAGSRATGNVLAAIDRFFSSATLKPHRTKARDSVVQYMKDRLTSGTLATLEDIVHAATVVVPAGEQGSLDGLAEFLNDEKTKVPDSFLVHAATLKRKTRIREDSGTWALQFEHQVLGESPDAPVQYDRVNKTLTLNELSDQLVRSVESELANR